MWINLITFGVVFIIVLVFCLIKYFHKLKKKKQTEVNEIKYLIYKFNLDKNKINYKVLNVIISSVNALIIAFVSTLVCVLPADKWYKLMLAFMVAFVILMGLIYSLYEIIGRALVRKWGKNNGK